MHILQPKHSKINKKEEDELLQKLNISKTQLPKIKLTDPALLQLGQDIKIGDIIKIERKSSNGEESFFYYRVVI
ncbi:DNA-directed RNA polymerase subunit H [Candidatus Pacearchaeota archaeon]|nr:DNA-directed RNA polymerase subunit H [Candidatus Pacearchaeota archaeon]MBI4156878.1 DNA-directed RNA polymerase subunit H [Candidatus Woesearchaeota archaeon]